MHPNRAVIAATATIESVARPDEDGRTPRRWWNSFVAAQDVHLACEIPLSTDRPSFPVLFAIGYDAAGSSSGRTSGRVRVARQCGPARNDGAAHADQHRRRSADHRPRGRPGALAGGRSRRARGGGGLFMALTGRASLWGVPDPDTRRSEAATAIGQALWPVLWQRSLKDTADGSEEIWRLGEWATRHVYAFGPYPVLRLADLPYGILPISDYGRWVWRAPVAQVRAGDPKPELLALTALPVLSAPLLQRARDQGTAAGADTEPSARDPRARPDVARLRHPADPGDDPV